MNQNIDNQNVMLFFEDVSGGDAGANNNGGLSGFRPI